MKIQINSLQALERLIGGDTEIEIDIRQSVVEKFSQKHLKTLANDAMMKKMSDAIITDIQSKFFDFVKEGYNSKLKFKEVELATIKEKIDYEVGLALSKAIQNEAGLKTGFDAIRDKIKNVAEWVETELGAEYIEKRLERMVDERIKQKLGLK